VNTNKLKKKQETTIKNQQRFISHQFQIFMDEIKQMKRVGAGGVRE
jgi:hypothetical protein